MKNSKIDFHNFSPGEFDFTQFEFVEHDSARWKLEEYKKQFLTAAQDEVNKKQIFHQTIELIYSNAIAHLNTVESDLPIVFR